MDDGGVCDIETSEVNVFRDETYYTKHVNWNLLKHGNEHHQNMAIRNH